MPLADFSVETEYEGVPRHVRVVVYDSVAALRSAATRYDNAGKRRSRRRLRRHDQTLGICHRFEWIGFDGATRPDCAIIRLARPWVGAGVVSHECAHAAVWMRQLHSPDAPLLDSNDEPFAWTLGDLVRQVVEQLYEHGVYDEDPA